MPTRCFRTIESTIASSATVDPAVDSSGVAVTYVNVWMSGAGGGYGSRAHGEGAGGAAGFAFGSLAVNPGDVLSLYVGGAGETSAAHL